MESPSDWRQLKLVHPESAPHGARVDVCFELSGDELVARFSVKGVPTNANRSLPKDCSQWGLWEWDVVELFVAADPTSRTYYEFQVSPLGQYFELEIYEPRKSFNKEFRSGLKHSARLQMADAWAAELRVPLKSLSWDGNPRSLRGNAFAILSKTYWSLHLPYQEKPDFHLPQYFQQLF